MRNNNKEQAIGAALEPKYFHPFLPFCALRKTACKSLQLRWPEIVGHLVLRVPLEI